MKEKVQMRLTYWKVHVTGRLQVDTPTRSCRSNVTVLRSSAVSRPPSRYVSNNSVASVNLHVLLPVNKADPTSGAFMSYAIENCRIMVIKCGDVRTCF